MLYLYAIINRTMMQLPHIDGIDGACLQIVAAGDVAAVVSPVGTPRLAPEPENVLRHESVIEALMIERAVLPSRFGTILPDEEAVCNSLQAHHDAFVENLRFVAGRVEVGLRVLWNHDERRMTNDERRTTGDGGDGGPPLSDAQGWRRDGGGRDLNNLTPTSLLPYSPTPGGGRAYLMARLVEERAAQERRALAEDRVTSLHGPLQQLAIACTHRVLATPRLLLTAAYLIEREHIDEFKAEVARLSAAHPDLRLLGTGPWPPYHFVPAGGERVNGSGH
jgi:hypothetical protein